MQSIFSQQSLEIQLIANRLKELKDLFETELIELNNKINQMNTMKSGLVVD